MMPLVDNQTWFTADPGDGLPVKRRPRQAAGDVWPGSGFLFPGFLSPGAPCWDTQQRARPSPRPWQPTPDDSFILPQPTATSALIYVPPDVGHALRRRPWMAATDDGALGLLPPGMISDRAQQFASQQPDNALQRPARRFVADKDQERLWFFQAIIDPVLFKYLDTTPTPARKPRRFSPPGEDIVPIWTFGAGQAVPPASWGMDSGAGQRRSARFWPAQETALPPLLGVTDIPVSLVGWRDDPPPMRWRRPAFRAQEMTALPPLIFLDVTLVGVAPLAMQPSLIRSRAWHATAPEDPTAALWWGGMARIDAQGRMSWDVPQPYPRLPRRTAWRDEGAAPILAAQQFALPWLSMDDGSRIQARAPFRAFGDSAAGQSVEWVWSGPGVVVVAGPYYCVAGQLWQPGAIDADILTAD